MRPDIWKCVTRLMSFGNSTVHPDGIEDAKFWYTRRGYTLIPDAFDALCNCLSLNASNTQYEVRLLTIPKIDGFIYEDNLQVAYPIRFNYGSLLKINNIKKCIPATNNQ